MWGVEVENLPFGISVSEMNGHLHAPVALSPGKQPPRIEWEAGRTPDPALNLRSTEIAPDPARYGTKIPQL